MEPLVRTEQQIAGLKDFATVVAAMRSLAALRVQEARQAMAGVHRFAVAADRALASAVPLLAARDDMASTTEGPIAVVVFGAEHGFVGALHERLVQAALHEAGAHASSRLLVVGSRTARKAAETGTPILWTHAMANRMAGVLAVVRLAADAVYQVVADGVSRVSVIAASAGTGGQPAVQSRSLLPFDVSPYRGGPPRAGAPLHYLQPDVLIGKLIEEVVFAELMRAAVDAFAGEHAARLATMEAAHDAIDDKLQHLRLKADAERQENITTELLDIVAGAEAAQEQSGPSTAR